MSHENKPIPRASPAKNFPPSPVAPMVFEQALERHRSVYELVRARQSTATDYTDRQVHREIVIPPQQLRVGRTDDGPAPTGAAIASKYKALYPASWPDAPTANTLAYLQQKLVSDHALSGTNIVDVSINTDVIQCIMEQMITSIISDFPVLTTRAETEADWRLRRWGMYGPWMMRLVSKSFYLVLLAHWRLLVEKFYQQVHDHLHVMRGDVYMFDEVLAYLDPWLYMNFRDFRGSTDPEHQLVMQNLNRLVMVTVNIKMRLILKQLSDAYLQHFEVAPYTIVCTGPSLATDGNKVELTPPNLMEFAEYLGGTLVDRVRQCQAYNRRDLVLYLILSDSQWDMLSMHSKDHPEDVGQLPKSLERYLQIVRTRNARQLEVLTKSKSFLIRLEESRDYPVEMKPGHVEEISCISKWLHVDPSSHHHMVREGGEECSGCLVDMVLPFRSLRKDWTVDDSLGQDPQEDIFASTYTREMLEMGGLPDGIEAYDVVTGNNRIRREVEVMNPFVKAHVKTAWVLDALHGEADRLVYVENMLDIEDGPLGIDLPDESVMATDYWHNSEFYDLRLDRDDMFLSCDTVFRANYMQYIFSNFPELELYNPAHNFCAAPNIDFVSFLNPDPITTTAHTMHKGFGTVGWKNQPDGRFADLILNIARNTPDIRDYHIRVLTPWASNAPINSSTHKRIYRDIIEWVKTNKKTKSTGLYNPTTAKVCASLNKILKHWSETDFCAYFANHT